jgi:3-hydroxybutyryl-CoA dehydrogenase
MDRVQTIGIVGAGPRGRVIARLALLGGYRVILEDLSESRLAESKADISRALEAAVARGDVDASGRGAIAANLFTTHSVDEVSREADLLIDATPEEVELQLEMFTIFDKFAKPLTILASTSDSIAIADLAEITNCAERCVGLRVQERADQSKSLTIVRGPRTDEQTVDECFNLARRLGLEPSVAVTQPTEVAAIERELHRP